MNDERRSMYDVLAMVTEKQHREARDEVHAALGKRDAPDVLRSLAIDLASRGFDRAALTGVFGAVAEELAFAGREEEAALVADILDMIDEWYGESGRC